MTPQPKDIYYHPNKPACLKHGWGHWTKDCTELQAQSPVSSEPTHSDIMAMMAAIQKYWVTASGEPELWGFAKYVLGLVASETTKARIDERESMKFIYADGVETYAPYAQYRFVKDGLILNWEDRTEQLKAELHHRSEGEKR